jgi:hypothetical protein
VCIEWVSAQPRKFSGNPTQPRRGSDAQRVGLTPPAPTRTATRKEAAMRNEWA